MVRARGGCSASERAETRQAMMGKLLVIGGAVLVVLGLLVMAGFPLFRLPGDFTVRRGPVTFYFPLATSILLSILFTLLTLFFRR